MPELASIEGLPGLKAALERRVNALVQAKAALVVEEADEIASDARRTAPYSDVDSGDGHIRDDITVAHGVGVSSVTVENRHGAFQEFGTSRNAAQPFMNPAAARARRRLPAKAAAIFRKAVG